MKKKNASAQAQLRQRVASAVLGGMGQTQAHEVFGMGLRSLNRWMDVARTGGLSINTGFAPVAAKPGDHLSLASNHTRNGKFRNDTVKVRYAAAVSTSACGRVPKYVQRGPMAAIHYIAAIDWSHGGFTQVNWRSVFLSLRRHDPNR